MRLFLDPADRPPTVAWFEWLSILILAYNCLVSDVPWLAVLAFALLMLWNIVAISRQRSRAAHWLLTVINAIFYATLPFRLSPGDLQLSFATLGETIEWAVLILYLTTLWLLWSRPMSVWIASRPKVETRFPV